MPSFRDDQQHTFPALPPSLSAGGHEMRDYHTAPDVPRPTINQAPYITPYLGLRARLSQIWINRWTILLLLVLARTLIAVASLDDSLDSARRQALSACSGVESVGSAMASMPHFMSKGVNELTASGVEKAVNGLMSMLDLSVTGVEEIVVFIFNLLTSTYVCLITLAVNGSVTVAVDVAKEVTEFLDKALGEIGDDIQKGVNGFQDTMNTVIGGLNSIPSLFGSNKEIPKLNMDREIDRLKNLQLPAEIEKGLDKLKDSIPTFAEVNNATNTLIRTPFEEIKKLIGQELVAYKFDRSVFPVPAREQLSFCSDNEGINDFFDRLVSIANLARKVFIGVVVVLAVLACVPMAWREIRRWRLMQQRSQLISRNAFDPMDVVYISSRPYSSTLGIKVANRSSSTRRQTLIRWAVAYATSTQALFVLSLGVAGLFACLCQLILLKAVEKEVPALTGQVGAFADKVVLALNNASTQWADQTNLAIKSTNDGLNKDIFGWVSTSTHALNDTLNQFVDGMKDALDVTFGDTVLRGPIEEVLNCLITLKVQGIQKALTWVSDHAHIDFPLMPNDTFSLGALASLDGDQSKAGSFLAAPSSVATDGITDAVVRMTRKIESGIRTEALISLFVCLIWVFVAVVGFARSGFLLCGSDKTRAEGGGDGRNYAPDPITDNLRVREDLDTAPPYMAEPLQFQVGNPSSSSSSSLAREHGSSSEASASAEKLGSVEARRHVGQATKMTGGGSRASSYGHLAEATPVEKSSYLEKPFVGRAR